MCRSSHSTTMCMCTSITQEVQSGRGITNLNYQVSQSRMTDVRHHM
ncbi:hypothetical protein GBAR_LOCUS14732 [Geodia barretti]|uniref:Uncharacterized protein n=1 Tax=Geodia barretti TaxID=519541 RepID=A0AA35WSY3_GEOBA|nr:hypothetical protein GBAR_LOCUS14732 [Geodia barretti]